MALLLGAGDVNLAALLAQAGKIPHYATADAAAAAPLPPLPPGQTAQLVTFQNATTNRPELALKTGVGPGHLQPLITSPL